jgi:hypothetical protein
MDYFSKNSFKGAQAKRLPFYGVVNLDPPQAKKGLSPRIISGDKKKHVTIELIEGCCGGGTVEVLSAQQSKLDDFLRGPDAI